MIEFASGQITGKRAAQEDALDVLRLGDAAPLFGAPLGDDAVQRPNPVSATAAIDPGVVLAVADGMGGHVGGRIASSLSIRAFLSTVAQSADHAGGDDWGRRLEAGLLEANAALARATAADPGLDGMGSTLTGAIVSASGIGWISIGDTALYLYQNGILTRLNEDHSFGAYLDSQVREGLMTPEAAAGDRRRNHLFYALLGDHLDHYEPFSGFRPLRPGDLVIVASDGLKTLSDDDIRDQLAQLSGASTDGIVKALLDAVAAADRERQDNVSLVVARIGMTTDAQARIGGASALKAVNDAPASHRLDEHVETTGIIPPPTRPRGAAAIPMPRTTQPAPRVAPSSAAASNLSRGARWRQAGLFAAGAIILILAGVIIARLL